MIAINFSLLKISLMLQVFDRNRFAFSPLKKVLTR